jgi:phenylacetic acid degradation operon negative regulatory protein
VHALRLFLFSDPGLPDAMLPSMWPGHEAARRFDDRARDLLPAAREWVDHWLDGAGGGIAG